jgi:hypothetical protein
VFRFVKLILIVRLLSPAINGIDLSNFQVGDVIRVSDITASMLIREGWAVLVDPGGEKLADW